jgi:hypothetical protein
MLVGVAALAPDVLVAINAPAVVTDARIATALSTRQLRSMNRVDLRTGTFERRRKTVISRPSVEWLEL